MNGRPRRLADVLSDTFDGGLGRFGNDQAIPIGRFGRGAAHSPALDLLEGVHGAVERSPQSRNFFIHDEKPLCWVSLVQHKRAALQKSSRALDQQRGVKSAAEGKNCELEQRNLVLARLLTQ